MKKADFSTVEDLVRRTIGATPIGASVAGITIDRGEDEDGDEFLRVLLRLHNLPKLSYEDLAPMVETVERAVGEIDERFASVRFAEAA